MSEHFDARETRTRLSASADLYERLPALVATAVRAPGWRAHLGNIDPAAINNPAALAGLPVLRKGGLPALQKEAPPFGGLLPRRGLLVRPAVHFTRADLRAGGPARRRLAGGARPVRCRLPPRRRGAEHLFLSPDARRLIPDSGARAIGCSVIPAGRQHRAATGTDRAPAPGRLLRHTRLSEDPARRRRQGGTAGGVDPPRGRLRRGIPAVAAAEIRDRGIDAYQISILLIPCPILSAAFVLTRRRARAGAHGGSIRRIVLLVWISCAGHRRSR